MRCIIMYGSPGSGKGTQSKLLNLTHISTGDVLRGSETGRRFLEDNPGKLAPDSMMNEIVQERIEQLGADFILDGYPRTVPQADVLVKYLTAKKIPLVLIYLNLEDESEAMRRMIARGRPDDTPDTIKERFIEFHTKTVPVYEFLVDRVATKLVVDANRPPENIFRDIENYLGVSIGANHA